MKIPNPPFHLATDGLLYALLIGGECLAYDTIQVDADNSSGLSAPEGCVYALLIMEADSTAADKSRVARFREDGIPASAAEGVPLGDLTTYEVKGKNNISNFSIIGIEADKIHLLRVQYYN